MTSSTDDRAAWLRQRRSARRTALWVGAVALGFYLGFFLLMTVQRG